MANTARDLQKRLLHLFPISFVKDHFQVTGNAEDVIEQITGSKTKALQIAFAFDHFRFTKQNIYLFELNKNFTRTDIGNDFPWTIEKEVKIGNDYFLLCFPKTTYTVYLSNPTTEEEISFYQPVLIRISQKRMIIHFVKLEKKLSSYFPADRVAKLKNVANAEDVSLRKIVEYLGNNYTVSPYDFNRGMKYLWHIDDVDCYKIQSRNPHSVRLETMDGTLTYKQKYPAEYQAIILTPLGMAHWKYLLSDDYFCEGFSADPSGGLISFTKFPKLPNQVNNVINKILANN